MASAIALGGEGKRQVRAPTGEHYHYETGAGFMAGCCSVRRRNNTASSDCRGLLYLWQRRQQLQPEFPGGARRGRQRLFRDLVSFECQRPRFDLQR